MSSLEGYVEGMINLIDGGGGGGSDVTITPILETGTKIANFTIGETSGELYAPTPIPPVQYTAGANVQISEENVISATDTKYIAGNNITIENDVISASGGDINYSTTERVIGSWVDGKPLYEKTFTGLSQATNGQDWVTIQGVNLPSVKDIINATAWATGGTGEQIRITLAEISVVNNNGIRVTTISNAFNRTINKMTVQYTKTTD